MPIETIVQESAECPPEQVQNALRQWIQACRRGARLLMNGKRSVNFRVPDNVCKEIGSRHVVIDSLGIRHPANYTQIFCDRRKLDRWLADM